MENEFKKDIDSEEDEELVDVDVWEFSLTEEEIDELIDNLKELKQNKSSVSFNIDEDNELLIHYEDCDCEDCDCCDEESEEGEL